ncbi:Uncharacterised protein g872 [Pycnogonum litorale]
MEKQRMTGYVLRYKKRLFGKDWRKEYLILFKDSRLLWYKDKDEKAPDGGVIIKDSPGTIAIGVYTARAPYRPDLPPGFGLNQLIAIGTKDRHKVYWFLCNTEEDASRWLSAICDTLPPAPGRRISAELQQMNGLVPSKIPPPLKYSDGYKPDEQDDKIPLTKDGGGSSSAAVCTGLLVGGAMACSLGWGTGLGWGFGIGGDYDYSSVQLFMDTADPGIHHSGTSFSAGDDHGGYDCGDSGGYDGDFACDFGAIF